ncbi:hypothetical protein KP509_25G015200 [Ceratopteris richardii]|uniref:CCHC-type domain-containing protein n=1 Tax=Ceratopteris richardii TaxID=49495 RepID=A0A8T2RQ92_CERRI|nr:hypothetical protein KP509_25G015200 [Ceratopteris richardii]
MELLYEPMGGPGNIPMKGPGQGSPALMTPAFVAATSTSGEGQGGDYSRRVARDQRRYGPIQCWRCHGFGHTQSRCPNEKKLVDYTPLCRYCSGEGHFDEDCPKRRATTGKDKGPVGSSKYVETQMHCTPRAQEPVPTIGVVFRTPNPQEGSSSSMHFVDAYQAKKPHKEPIVAVVTRTQEYLKKHPKGESEKASQEKIPEHGEVEHQVGGFAEHQEFEDGEEIEILPPVTKEIVPGITPFPERLRVPKCKKERQSLKEVDIVKLLADTEVTLDIGTLLKCSPVYRRQFYNEYIKKPRKARDKKRQDKDVQGMIQSITMQIDSNAPTVTVEIKGYVVPGAQLDSGAAVNLMTEYMMKALGLNHMEETPMSLRMADQTQVKPAGLLKKVSTVVGGLEFKVDYLIVRPRTSEATFLILLGRPWLMQANCVHDSHTGSLRTRRRMADQVYQSALFDLVVYFSDQALENMEISVESLRTNYDVEEAHWLVRFWNQGMDIDFSFPKFEAYLLSWAGYAKDRYFYYDSTMELPNEVNDIYWAWADLLTIGSDDGAPKVEPDSP